jgi:transcription-repair coupling factor (superfamily II helicase)
MNSTDKKQINEILIAGITPYFLKRGNLWFAQNLKKILKARQSQTFFQENTLYLERNLVFNLSHLLRRLDEMGYEKVYQVSDIGEFAQRGGIIDVFPINSNFAVRLEFLGNKIEIIEAIGEQIKNEQKEKQILEKRLKTQKLFSDLKNLKAGDYLVHLDHGIGRFIGKGNISDYSNDNYYILEYAKGDKLYVPLSLTRKLSRYVAFVEPNIPRLNSILWQKTKRKIKENAIKLAKELLDLYAKRETAKRPPYTKDDELDLQLASSFKYQETPDQIEAMKEIRKDLEKEKPMDRLLCGDVGFGKTEIALRTMLKAVKSGYQVAMLCPTTILANQHFNNFSQRLKNLPIETALFSRLQSKSQQKDIIKKLADGKIDFVVGTHRILSKDVIFKNLGLLIIDDEQRFGVKQKERLKKLKASIDILSLSATPIPRTLYLSLSSLRDMTTIQTPPEGRMPIDTFILPYSLKTVKKAVEKEISRRGQVYYLHNRVETIQIVKKTLQKLLPKVKFGVAHGRLTEKQIVGVMNDFQNKKIDILIATTIIESGLDLANVNTLVVANAALLGLSQAYQLRGRIGRSNVQSYAYFLYGRKLRGKAKMRLAALKEAKELGSGFQIAQKDLEIRGAGNILGKEQSGSINKVGLNLYCQMLAEAIEKLKVNQT